MVALNRYDKGKRSKSEIIVGACVGILVVVLLYGLAILYIDINSLEQISSFIKNLRM